MWHISLSEWCKDFIFMPFIVKYRKMGNKVGIWGIFITFFVIGIWHGANWTYVVLGLLQGMAINYENFSKGKRVLIANKLPSKIVIIFSRITTFCFFSFSLIYFNARTIGDAWYFTTHLFSNLEFNLFGHHFIFNKFDYITAIIAFVFLFTIEFYQEKGVNVTAHFLSKPRWVRWSGYYIMIAAIYFFSNHQETFVYLQF